MTAAVPDIAGRVYVVTGASRGVGLAVTGALAARGAKIVMIARGTEDLEARAAEFGACALPFACDVADAAAMRAAIDRGAAHFGGLDGIVNNAGLSRIGPLDRIAPADLRLLFNVHVIGALNGTQATLPHLRRRGGGNIVNISSATVAHPDEFAYIGGYSAVKACLERLSAEMFIEFARDNVAVTTFRLGSTVTNFGSGWDPEIAAEAFDVWEKYGGLSPKTMDPSLPAEQIVRCLETPPDACSDFVSFRPYTMIPKGRRMAE